MKVQIADALLASCLTFLVELGVVIGREGSNIKEENAMKHVAGYALALDLTARDIQVRDLDALPLSVLMMHM